MPTDFYIHQVHTFIHKFVRVGGKIRAFLVLKYIQKHIQHLETTFMKMHSDTVEPPVLASERPLWQPRGRAQGSRPAGPPAAPRSAHLPVWAPKSLRSPKSSNITAAQGGRFGGRRAI